MNKVLGGIILIFILVVAVAGLMIFDPFNSKSTGISSSVINNVNQNGNNTTNINDNNVETTNTLLTPILASLKSYYNPSKPIPSPSPGPGPSPDPTDHMISLFDAYVKSIFPQAGVPGAAVVIVKDNKIIYMNPLGFKDIASGAPVTKDTLFEIGSCSKAFTATNIAQLVSLGLMSWDDPISKYYNDTNEFQMYDPSITDKLTIRDCFSHRSGQPGYSQDMEWMVFNDSYSRMLYNLRLVKNDSPFNTTYNYNNIIYALPAYCAAKVTGTKWSDLIKEDLLKPLSMITSTSTVNDFLNSPDHITPYRLLGNGTYVPFFTNLDEIGPAGSLACSISDMANWLKFQIADTGFYNGVQVVNKSALDETRTGQIKFDDKSQYGFGWIISKIVGNDVITHAGDALSSQTVTSVFPSKGIGIVILTNVGPTGLNFCNTLFSKLALLLGGNETYDPWPLYKDMNKPVPYPDPQPPLIEALGLGNYTGVYNNYLYGNITVTLSNNTLQCLYGSNQQSVNLVHWNENVFLDNLPTTLNFTDIHDGSAHQLIVNDYKDYNTTPATNYSVFNRTNST